MKLRNYINKSYRRQLQLYFIIASVIPISISGFLLVNLFRYQADRDLSRQDLAERDRIESVLLDSFSTVESGMEQVEEDPDLTASLQNGKVISYNVYAALYRTTRDLRTFASVDIYSGGRRIYSTDSGNEIRTLPTDFGILARAEEHSGTAVYEAGYLENGDSWSGNQHQEPCLQIAKKISGNGYVVITIRQENLNSLLQGSYRGDEGILVVNRFWEPVYQAGALAEEEQVSLLRQNLFAGKSAEQGLGSNYYSRALGDTGLTLVYLTPPALSENIFRSMMNVVIVFALLAIPLSLLFAGFMSRRLSHPISELDDAMRKFRHGDMAVRVKMDRDDEIGQLAEGFNKTAVRIRENMDERIRQQKKLNETEIAMMQAQLNPHFLYNTLDTIKWVGKENNVPEVAELSQNLAKLLRQSISDRQFITLSEELDLVENYCNIQEFRFGYAFSYECEVPEDLMSCMVPKLILQPVVENAIIHGLEGVEDGLVKVTAEKRPGKGEQAMGDLQSNSTNAAANRFAAPVPDANAEDLEIIVTDNGKGISDEMIAVLDRHDAEQLKGHLGFRNVDTILRMFYGDTYGIHAERRQEGGTKVSILLPLQQVTVL